MGQQFENKALILLLSTTLIFIINVHNFVIVTNILRSKFYRKSAFLQCGLKKNRLNHFDYLIRHITRSHVLLVNVI